MPTLQLKFALRDKGISYSRLAAAAGISKTAINDLINHNRWPDAVPQADLKKRVETWLTSQGVSTSAYKVWKLATIPEPKTQPTTKTKQLVLQGGPKVLPDDVLQRCGLSRDPFTNEMENVGDVLPTPQHNFVLKKMLDAAERRKFLGVHGPIGSGKSVLKTVFTERLDHERNYMIAEPQINEKKKCRPATLADAMIEDFLYRRGGVSAKGQMRAPSGLEAKNRWLISILRDKVTNGKKPVLIIDEAHDLPLETLRALKRFYEMQEGFKKMLSIIIIGQPELATVMSDFRIREVSARLDMVELKPIPNLVSKYLTHKIERAGGKIEKIIEESAIKSVGRLLPNANPLMINVLISNAIIKSWKADTFPVTAETVEMAFKEIASYV